MPRGPAGAGWRWCQHGGLSAPQRVSHSLGGLLRQLRDRSIESGQYTSIAFTSRLIDAGVDPSVGSVGDAYDNALAESTIGSYKTELINRCGPWRGVDHVEIETLGWVDWFVNERPHDYLNDLTPAAAEDLHYRHFHTQAQAG